MTTADQHNLDRFFSGTTNEKTVTMEKLFVLHRKQLLADKRITHSLALLENFATELSSHMTAMNLDSLCGNCASKVGGGCCSSYMEANSDVILLLMNRLHGIAISRQHDRAEDCCFLGASGCILPIKPMFCLNYNCSHIHDQATEAEMAQLEQMAGRILTEQTRLETMLLHIL